MKCEEVCGKGNDEGKTEEEEAEEGRKIVRQGVRVEDDC